MKPPRVIIKQGSFWVSCYVMGKKDPWKRPTGIKLDQKFIDALAKNPNAYKDEDGNWDPDWWKSSRHAPDIKEAVRAIALERELYTSKLTPEILGHPITKAQRAPARPSGPELDDLVDELNEEGSAEKKLSSETIRRRKTSANTIQRFDRNFRVSEKVDRKWVAKFRKWMDGKEREYSGWTQYTILQDLKLFFKFATRKRYIDHNPIADLNFAQPESLVAHTPIKDEMDMFRHLYNNDLPRFLIFMTQRLTGYRISDILHLHHSHLDMKNKLFVNALNIKGDRHELFPISDALFFLLNHCGDRLGKDRLFPDTYAAASEALKISAAAVPIKYTTHQCKRNYVLDVEDEDPLQHIFDLLIHHKTKSTAGRHYTARNIMLMRKVLNNAHGPWLTFLKEVLWHPPLWTDKRVRSPTRAKNRD